MTRCIGLYRERSHSPGRIDDDAGIMDAVGAALGRHGFDVELREADPAVALPTRGTAGVFAMCEREVMLRRLEEAEAHGVAVVNAPRAIRNTYRVTTAAMFLHHNVAAPSTWVIRTDAAPMPATGPLWVKRADFHATQAGDVTFVDGPAAWRDALAAFAARGLDRAVVQAHVPGDLVKFYGIAGSAGRPGWFHWFYHADQQLAGHAFAEIGLRSAAFAAAAALGVEIFGGDAIVDAAGGVWIIDLNAWPSFARVRDDAAAAIADRLVHRFTARETAPPRPLPLQGRA